MGATHTPQLTLQVGDSSITALRSRKPGTTCTNDAPGRRCCQVEREVPRRPGSQPPQGVARDSHGASPWRAGTAVGAPGWTLARVEAASRRFLPHPKAARCRFYLGTSICIGCSRITPPRARPLLRAVCARWDDAGLTDQKWPRRRPRPRNIARDPSTGARRTYPSGIRENQVGAPGPGAQRTPDVATEIWSQVMWSMAIQPAWRRGPKGIVPTPLGVSFPLPAIALLKDRLRPVTVKPVSRQ